MLRCTSLACALLLVAGVRVVKKSKSDPCFSRSGFLDCANGYLKWADDQPPTVGSVTTDIFKELANLDWSCQEKGCKRELMRGFAEQKLVHLGQFVAGAVHPVVGVVYSLVASVFGWGKAGSSSVANQILEQVGAMIDDAKRELRDEQQQDDLHAIGKLINMAKNYRHWHSAAVNYVLKMRSFYSKCFEPQSERDKQFCKDWRVAKDGGGAWKRLLTSASATRLMLTLATTMLEYDANETDRQWEADFAFHCQTATDLLVEHIEEYGRVRRDWSTHLQVQSPIQLHNQRTGNCTQSSCKVKCGSFNRQECRSGCCPPYFLVDKFNKNAKICNLVAGRDNGVVRNTPDSTFNATPAWVECGKIVPRFAGKADACVGPMSKATIALEQQMNKCTEEFKDATKKGLVDLRAEALEMNRLAKKLVQSFKPVSSMQRFAQAIR